MIKLISETYSSEHMHNITYIRILTKDLKKYIT